MTASATATAARPPASTHGGLAYLPGLDAVRALAVVAVLAFHISPDQVPGGYLGVSLFFTLSGYLIARLLIGDVTAHGQVSLGRFWERRFRRLMPTAVLGLALAAAVGAIVGGPRSLAGDIRAQLVYVLNWRLIARGGSYADLFRADSPVQHLWSLAVEEQFYLVFPLLIVAAGRLVRRRTEPWMPVLVAALGLAAMSVIAYGFVSTTDRAYYGTDTRALEIAAGALLAVAWPAVGRPVVSRLAGWIGLGGIVAFLVLCRTATLGADWQAHGGFGLIAVANVAVLVGALGAPVVSTTIPAAVRWIGTRSYGIYVYHWPLFVLLTADRAHVHGPVLAVLRLGATAAISEASFRWLERPIRERTALPRPADALKLAGGSVAALLLVTLVLPSTVLPSVADRLAKPGSEPTQAGSASGLTVWFAGDSVPYLFVPDAGAVGNDLGIKLINLGRPSCDGARGHSQLRTQKYEITEAKGCGRWPTEWPAQAKTDPPKVVVLMLGAASALERKFAAGYATPCDPVFRTWYAGEVEARIDLAVKLGAKVAVTTAAPTADPKNDIDRQANRWTLCIDDSLRAAVAARPAVAKLIDLSTYVCPTGEAGCVIERTDRLHYTGASAEKVARWMFPQLKALAAAP